MTLQILIFPNIKPHVAHFLAEKRTFQELNSVQCTMQGNCNPLENKDIRASRKGAYKPAYKKSQKMPADQIREMPVELAEIVAVWHDLPVHIKAVIKALVQTAIQGD